jgi:hypothetical protein
VIAVLGVSSTAKAAPALIDIAIVEPFGRPGHQGFFPIQGQPIVGSIVIVRSRMDSAANGVTINLRNSSGALFGQVPMITPPAANLWPAGIYFAQFQVPTTPFSLSVSGKDQAGNSFEISPPGKTSLISPQTIALRLIPTIAEPPPGTPLYVTVQATNFGASFVDKSVPNLSSIVVMVEAEGKRMLLTGDARGDKILEGLELVRLLEKGGNMHVDVLKVPHHGSDNNMAPVFFRRVMADHYVFSGNGEHGNPERATLEMLLDARGNANYEIHLTYPVDETDVERKKDWEKEQAKEKKKKKADVRADWSAKKNGLASFFADNKEMAKKIRIVEENKPHLIDLLDQVKF